MNRSNTKSFWEDRDYGGRGAPADRDEAWQHAPTRTYLERLLPALRGRSVLELGCGAGNLTTHLARSARDVLGVDFSGRALEAARRRCAGYANVSFVEANILEWDPGRRFDVLTGRMVLHEILHPETPDLLTRLDALLERDGFLWFQENSYFNPLARFTRERLVGRFGIPKHGSEAELPFDARRYEMYREHFRYTGRFVLWVEAASKVYEYLIPWKRPGIERAFLAADRWLSRLQVRTGKLDDWSYSQLLYASHARPIEQALGVPRFP